MYMNIFTVHLRGGLSVKGYNPKGFLDILDGMWWNIDRHLTLEQTKLSAYATYIDSIKNGVTTVFDHHASFGHIEGSLHMPSKKLRRILESVPVSAMKSLTEMEWKNHGESVMENVNFIRHAD